MREEDNSKAIAFIVVAAIILGINMFGLLYGKMVDGRVEKAREVLKDSTYFATMLVKMGIADGLVCGATHSTADTLRPGLQIIKAGEGVTTVSAFSIMEVPNCEFGNNGTFFFADTGLVENPNAEQLAEIAIVTADSYKAIMDDEPIVAMLSYSTYGSAKSELTEKVIEATKIVKERRPDLLD